MSHLVDVSVERDPTHDGILLLRQKLREGDLIHHDYIDIALGDVPDFLARIKEETGLPEDPRPPIWYLGSPYTNDSKAVTEQRYRHTCQAAARLFERSILVYSPIAHTVAVNEHGALESSAFEFWRTFDLGMIDRLTGLMVLMLDGWERSVGLTAELAHAHATGKPVLWCEPTFEGGEVTGYVLHETQPVAAEA